MHNHLRCLLHLLKTEWLCNLPQKWDSNVHILNTHTHCLCTYCIYLCSYIGHSTSKMYAEFYMNVTFILQLCVYNFPHTYMQAHTQKMEEQKNKPPTRNLNSPFQKSSSEVRGLLAIVHLSLPKYTCFLFPSFLFFCQTKYFFHLMTLFIRQHLICIHLHTI